MTYRTTASAALAVVGAFALAACAADGSGAPPAVSPPPPGRATLRLEDQTIGFPLDRYVMTHDEVRLMEAANNVARYRCVFATDEVPADVVAGSQGMLHDRGMFEIRMWGWWDAPFVAKYGLSGPAWTPSDPGWRAPSTRWNQLETCNESAAVQGLIPISYGYYSTDGSQQAALAAYDDSFAQTSADPRYPAILRARDQCIKDAGYPLAPATDNPNIETDGVAIDSGPGAAVPSDGVVVAAPNNGTSEAELRALLAEATCDDALGTTQQLADIAAGYQEQWLAAHEAEAVATRAEADKRVAAARAILEAAGVL